MTRLPTKNSLIVSRVAAPLAVVTVAATGIALWARYRARKAERHYPPVGRFIEIDGVRLHYVEEGDGPPVVLLHGNAVLLQDFVASGLLERLARRHRVIAFDRPGFGFSERPSDRRWTAEAQAGLLQQALSQLDVRRPVVLGHSWGTLVALAMAANPSADLSGLVLVSGFYYPAARLDVALSAPMALPVVGDVMRYTVSPLASRLSLLPAIKTMFAPARIPEDFFTVVPREMLVRPSQIRATAEDAASMNSAAAKLQSRYRTLNLPVSIFAGSSDKVVDPASQSERLDGDLPSSTLTVVPEAGHMMHYARAQQIADAVDALSGGSLTGQSPVSLVQSHDG